MCFKNLIYFDMLDVMLIWLYKIFYFSYIDFIEGEKNK